MMMVGSKEKAVTESTTRVEKDALFGVCLSTQARNHVTGTSYHVMRDNLCLLM